MAGQALNPSENPLKSEATDPLEAAQQFTRQMAANALIEDQLIKSKAGASKALSEAEEAKVKAERARTGGGGESQDSPLKVKGSVDLGTFNYQDLLKQQSDDLKELKREADEQASTQASISNDLRERLHAKEMEVLTTSFGSQMQALKEMVAVNASRGSFMDQYNGVMDMAKTIGFSQPQLAGDVTSQISLEKMKFEQNIELKRMARDDKRSDREFQRQLNRDADDRKAREAEQTQQNKRDDMFAKAPQYIGGAIAQGLLANQGRGGGVTEEAPVETNASKGKQGKHIETGWGESGEVECPGCSQPMAIGPTARVAVCANCAEKVPIRRTGEKPSAEEE